MPFSIIHFIWSYYYLSSRISRCDCFFFLFGECFFFIGSRIYPHVSLSYASVLFFHIAVGSSRLSLSLSATHSWGWLSSLFSYCWWCLSICRLPCYLLVFVLGVCWFFCSFVTIFLHFISMYFFSLLLQMCVFPFEIFHRLLVVAIAFSIYGKYRKPNMPSTRIKII